MTMHSICVYCGSPYCTCFDTDEEYEDARMSKQISEHEGKKYLRRIFTPDGSQSIEVDIYCVLKAFDVTCPARGHAVKKLLACGGRGKGNAMADLLGVEAAVARAIEIQRIEDQNKQGEKL